MNAQATSVVTHIRNNQLDSTDLKVTVCTAGASVTILRSEASNRWPKTCLCHINKFCRNVAIVCVQVGQL